MSIRFDPKVIKVSKVIVILQLVLSTLCTITFGVLGTLFLHPSSYRNNFLLKYNNYIITIVETLVTLNSLVSIRGRCNFGFR